MKSENKIVGIELEKVSRERLVKIPMSDDLKKHFKIGQKPEWQKFLEHCLASEKNYNTAIDVLDKVMKEALPENISENCKYCNGDSEDELDKNCTVYHTQINITFLMGVEVFYNIVTQNKHILTNRRILQELTIKFINCLNFVKGKGVMFFDIDEISRHCLEAGFLSLSLKFSNSEPLKNLAIINDTLNSLSQTEIHNRIFNKEDSNYICVQKQFFQEEQRNYKEKIFISEKENSAITAKCSEENKPKENNLTLKEIALKYVYENKNINRDNGKKIASSYNYNSKNSGEKLYQHFTFYSSRANRKGIPDPYSKIKLKNKIELFEKVIKTLEEPNKSSALDDLKSLKSHYN